MEHTLLEKVARAYGATTAEVQQEMEAAIEAIYHNPNPTPEQRRAREAIPRKGQIPTIEEFVAYVAGQMK